MRATTAPAGSLWVQMGLDLARLAKDMAAGKAIIGGAMNQMNSAIGTVRNALGLLGVGLSVGYFVNFLKHTNDTVSGMKELGIEAGVSAEAISRFEGPARFAGLGLETVAKAMYKMNTAALEAKDPTSKAALALNAIGISTAQLKDLKPDEMFELVARKISLFSDGLSKNNVMQELFGKQGREMNRVIAEIADKSSLAATVTNDQAEAAKKLNDQVVELQMSSDKFWRSIVATAVPAMNSVLSAFIEGKEKAGLWQGAIDALSASFGMLFDKSLSAQLDEVNRKIGNVQQAMVSKPFGLSLFGQAAKDTAQLNDLLARRKELEAMIWQSEFEAQMKRQLETKAQEKPKIEFDPKRLAFNVTIAEKQAQATIEFNEQVAKSNAEVQDSENARILGLVALSNKYQEMAQTIISAKAREGEAIFDALGTEREIEDRAYADKLERLNAYFAEKEDFTVQDQARLEALQKQHEFNMNNQNSLGIKSQTDIKKMGLDGQLEYYTGTLANITAAGAQHDKRLFALNKTAAIANAIVSTYRGAAAAYEWGMPLGPIFAGIIIAAGMANVRAISATTFGGGSSAPSIGGGHAIPTTPAPGTTTPAAQPQAPGSGVTIIIQGFVGTEDFLQNRVMPVIRDIVDNKDFQLIGPNSRQAMNLRSHPQ